MRDWLSTLYPASFRGVEFWIEKDDERGGRRKFVHQFPNRDEPYVEDLGSQARRYEVVAYLASDAADSDADALVAALDQPGAGTLVLPMQGFIQASCHTYARARERDRAGYVAFQISFVREGAAQSIISADYSAQLMFDAGDALSAAAQAAAPVLIDVINAPGWIADNVVAEFQSVAASLETIRSAAVLAPTDSQTIATSLSTFYAAIPAGVSGVTGIDPTVIASAFTLSSTLAAAMSPTDAQVAFANALATTPEPLPQGSSGSAATDYSNRVAASAIGALALLNAYAQAVVSATYASRDDAVAARTAIMGYFDAALATASGGLNADLYVAVEDLRNRTIEALAATIANLAPLVAISAAASMPSLWWAWRLYQDPTRTADLIARNKVRHPSYMPETFEALAS